MKAFLFTRDRLSEDVLTRSLVAEGYTDVRTLEPSAGAAQELPYDDERIVLVDFDLPDVAEVTLNLPSDVVIVPFGSFASRERAPGSIEAAFLTKPFSHEQIVQASRRALLDRMRLDPPAPTDTMPRSAPSLRIQLAATIDAIHVRRRELAALLTATPDQLRSLLLKAAPSGPAGVPVVPPHAFPVRTALLVESDASVSRLMVRYLANKCIMEADIAATGDDAWRRLMTKRYDVVIMQWEIPGLSGLALYNRIRSTPSLRYAPVVVTSSQVRAFDFRLLDEDFAIAQVAQPVAERALSEALEKVLGHGLLLQRHGDELTAIILQAARQGSLAEDIKALDGGHPDALLLNALKVSGDRLVDDGQVAQAEAAFALAWQLGDRRLSLLTGYARACHLAGHDETARRLLATADVLAPRNIERLCLLGEVDLCLREPETARKRFLSALAIDGKSKKARAGALIAGSVLERQAATGDSQPGLRFSAYLNLIGIDLSRSGRTKDAVHYYKAAMVFVHSRDDLTKLWFNLGLCYLRARRDTDARTAFTRAHELSGGTFGRVAKYLEAGETMPRSDDIPFERI